MYYVIEYDYVGPKRTNDEYTTNYHHFIISTEPETKNLSGEVCAEGWCGTTNDKTVYALGAFATFEEAEHEIIAIQCKHEYRKNFDPDGTEFTQSYYDNVCAVYKPGNYPQLTEEGTAHFISSGYTVDVTSDHTDQEIEELAEEYDAIARSEWKATIDKPEAIQIMKEFRQTVADEKDDTYDIAY